MKVKGKVDRKVVVKREERTSEGEVEENEEANEESVRGKG